MAHRVNGGLWTASPPLLLWLPPSQVNEAFLDELSGQPRMRCADAFLKASKQFKGCYTRYVNNYDAAEAKLKKIRTSTEKGDTEKHRYLTTATTHPDAAGKDVSSFLIQPVQRVMRYRLLLDDLLKHTEDDDPDQPSVREAYARVCELAQAFNEDKRVTDEFIKLRAVFAKFVDSDAATLRNKVCVCLPLCAESLFSLSPPPPSLRLLFLRSLVFLPSLLLLTPEVSAAALWPALPQSRAQLLSYERKLLKEGSLVKQRLSHRQRRTLFLFNDCLLYGAPSLKGIVLKGQIKLHDGARVESLPRTEEMPYALAIIERSGKGYTWVCESAEERDGWYAALSEAINLGKASMTSGSAEGILSNLPSQPLSTRLGAVRAGGTLTKYNKADGRSRLRWVVVNRDKAGDKIMWGDQKTKVRVRAPQERARQERARGSARGPHARLSSRPARAARSPMAAACRRSLPPLHAP